LFVSRLCPIFQLSNVTGEGLDLVRTFLNLLPSSEADEAKFSASQPFEVRIYAVFCLLFGSNWITVLDH
jgi:GTPase